MKILTLNFLTCARKQCKPLAASFPLHLRDVTLEYAPTSSMTSSPDTATTAAHNPAGESTSIPTEGRGQTDKEGEKQREREEEEEEDDSELVRSQVRFLENILGRVEWPALRQICGELGMTVPWEGDIPPDAALLWETDAAGGRSVGEEEGTRQGGEEMDLDGQDGAGPVHDSAAEVGGEDEEEELEFETGEERRLGQAGQDDSRLPSRLAKDLHRLLLETVIAEGSLVCGACQHAYAVKEGIANFLLPAHML